MNDEYILKYKAPRGAVWEEEYSGKRTFSKKEGILRILKFHQNWQALHKHANGHLYRFKLEGKAGEELQFEYE